MRVSSFFFQSPFESQENFRYVSNSQVLGRGDMLWNNFFVYCDCVIDLIKIEWLITKQNFRGRENTRKKCRVARRYQEKHESRMDGTYMR